MIVEDVLSPHTLLLKASSSNSFRLPSYRVVANVRQVRKLPPNDSNPISKLPEIPVNSTESVHSTEILPVMDRFIIFKLHSQKRLYIGKVVDINLKSRKCTVHYYGTYSESPILKNRTFFPSWRDLQGQHRYSNRHYKTQEAELKDVSFEDIVESDFVLLPCNKLPLHLANKYEDSKAEYAFSSFTLPSLISFNSHGDVVYIHDDHDVDIHPSEYQSNAATTHTPIKFASTLGTDREELLKSRKKELDSFDKHGVYRKVPLDKVPRNVRPIPMKFVDTKKMTVADDGSVSTVFKSRLVAIGFLDKRRHSAAEVATAMPSMDELRLFLLLVTSISTFFQPSDLQQADVSTAFLNAPLEDEDVYVLPPRDHPDFGKCFWLLRKSVYGLIDSPKRYSIHFHRILISLGWETTIFDGIYVRFKDGNIDGLLLVYVDDIIVGSGLTKASVLLDELQHHIPLSLRGVPKHFVGIDIDVFKTHIDLSQKTYADSLPVDSPSSPIEVPLNRNVLQEEDKSKILSESEATQYRSLLGTLAHLRHTRIDLKFALSFFWKRKQGAY